MSNFHPLEVVGPSSETQLQVGENYHYSIWLFKSSYMYYLTFAVILLLGYIYKHTYFSSSVINTADCHAVQAWDMYSDHTDRKSACRHIVTQ